MASVQRAIMLDEDLANMIDQIHLITGKSKSAIVNDALRVQLYLPSKFNAKEMEAMKNLAKSIISSLEI